MFTGLFMQDAAHPNPPKEGDLYKEVTMGGKTFRLVYGYYEDFERESQFNDPVPIYPNFIKEPHFTEEGIPFVTAMQDTCKHYSGRQGCDSCSECDHFQKGEELFGFCHCPENGLSPPERLAIQNE
ncbi:MAG: hypothetical protein IJ030_02035 [Oscillospiraceae bacterium]|nr:hypothetical protein [Oscillospiraceae bacterium]MBQ8880941.1 hypothetical protein [Oscillospiraceae bacterium]